MERCFWISFDFELGGKNMVDYVKKRARDFTHSKITGFSTSGGAKNFYKFLSEELIPSMESKYRMNVKISLSF